MTANASFMLHTFVGWCLCEMVPLHVACLSMLLQTCCSKPLLCVRGGHTKQNPLYTAKPLTTGIKNYIKFPRKEGFRSWRLLWEICKNFGWLCIHVRQSPRRQSAALGWLPSVFGAVGNSCWKDTRNFLASFQQRFPNVSRLVGKWKKWAISKCHQSILNLELFYLDIGWAKTWWSHH